MELFGIITINPESFNIWSLRISMSLTTTIFLIGCTMAVRAFLYTKGVDPAHLDRVKNRAMTPEDSLAERVAKMLWSTARGEESGDRTTPALFLQDATRQVAENTYDGRYVNRIYMCANLLPPIGLWGTVAGMIVIFLYTGDPGNALNKGAIGTKLWSTFLALMYYVLLETFCLFLTMRSRKSIDLGLNVKL
ncbi:MAG TPA: MotA/TolQ/ExbB proton channel family protein [Geobacteraceae bacterium]|nr:MotA/TolQ/ExbB proton channel family protein [Geobacteraceae bacterium]